MLGSLHTQPQQPPLQSLVTKTTAGFISLLRSSYAELTPPLPSLILKRLRTPCSEGGSEETTGSQWLCLSVLWRKGRLRGRQAVREPSGTPTLWQAFGTNVAQRLEAERQTQDPHHPRSDWVRRKWGPWICGPGDLGSVAGRVAAVASKRL